MASMRYIRRRLGWLLPARKSSAEVDLWSTQIDRAASILASAPHPAQIAEERARLRRKASRAERSAIMGWCALACVIAAGLYLGARELEVMGSGAALAAVLGLCVAAAVIVVLLLRLVITFAARQQRERVRAVLRFLNADGGEGRETEAVDWLDRHWPWPAPPRMFEGTTYAVWGSRRYRPFLMLSEHELGSDADWGPPVQRTCVFVAGHAPESQELADQRLPAAEVKCHLALTPAGLFAWWTPAADFAEQPPEWFGRVLDALIDVADREMPRPE